MSAQTPQISLRQRLIRLNLRHKLVALVFVSAAVPLSIMGGVTYYLMTNQMESGLNDLLEETGRSTARLMDSYILERSREVGLVSGSSTLRAGERGAAEYGLARYRETFTEFSALIQASPDGEILAAQGNPMLTAGDTELEQAVSGWTQEAERGARILDRVSPEPGDMDRYLVFVSPVQHEGQDYGWVFAQLDSERVAEFAMEVEVGETGRATLFNADGILIGHRDKSRYGYDMSHYPIMTEPVNTQTGNPGEFFLSGDGRDKWGMTLMLEESLEQFGLAWGIIVDQTVSELYAPVNFLNRVLWFLWVISLLFAVALGLMYANVLVRPLRHLASRLQNIASRDADLSGRVEVSNRDEVGQTAEAFNAVMDKLQKLIQQVATSSQQIGTATDQISSAAHETGKAIENEREEVDQVATAMNEMSSTVQEVAKSTQQAAESARRAVDEVQEGNELVNLMVDANRTLSDDIEVAANLVTRLKENSDNIDDILQVIRNVAEQTNLLALNAAIEAARAGEQGRGFAVVADEVRALARRTNDSTGEIQKIIENLQSGADQAASAMQKSRTGAQNGVEQSTRAGASLRAILEAINEINEMDENIASATEEQSTVAEEINRSVHRVSGMAEETSIQTKQMLAAIGEIEKLARELDAVVGQFRL